MKLQIYFYQQNICKTWSKTGESVMFIWHGTTEHNQISIQLQASSTHLPLHKWQNQQRRTLLRNNSPQERGLTISTVRLILKVTCSSRRINCWNRAAWMNAFARTHLASSTDTFNPFSLANTIAVYRHITIQLILLLPLLLVFIFIFKWPIFSQLLHIRPYFLSFLGKMFTNQS